MTLVILFAVALFVVGTIFLFYTETGDPFFPAFVGLVALLGAVFFVNQATQINVVANTCVAGVQEAHPEWAEMSNGALLDAADAYEVPAAVMTLEGNINKAKSVCFDRLQAQTLEDAD